MTRHSFIQMSKLPNVKGRVSYITNHARRKIYMPPIRPQATPIGAILQGKGKPQTCRKREREKQVQAATSGG